MSMKNARWLKTAFPRTDLAEIGANLRIQFNLTGGRGRWFLASGTVVSCDAKTLVVDRTVDSGRGICAGDSYVTDNAPSVFWKHSWRLTFTRDERFTFPWILTAIERIPPN